MSEAAPMDNDRREDIYRRDRRELTARQQRRWIHKEHASYRRRERRGG